MTGGARGGGRGRFLIRFKMRRVVQTNKRKLETLMLFLLISLAEKLKSERRNQKLLKGFGRREKKNN
nr:hypothetical protein [Tanacetum cinerariifolium]